MCGNVRPKVMPPSQISAALLILVGQVCGVGKDQLVHHISTFQIERTKTSATSLDGLVTANRQNQQKVLNRKSFYTLVRGK